VRAMSDDGSYVFFDSPEALVPQAGNGTLDVYEWHEDLVSGARSVSLVGSGADAAPSYFLGYSPYTTPGGVKVEAGSVFIGTHARLVAQDTGSTGDIYDARACVAESPCIGPPAGGTAQCEGGACQSPPVEPVFQTLATLSASGSGNVPAGGSAPKKKETAGELRAAKLSRALKVCRKERVKKRRVACEKRARKRYGAKKKTVKKKKKGKKARARARAGAGRLGVSSSGGER
jgi:hypothetical protein